ncbi:MAG: L,D-transpeptidase family protein [Phycisphaerales bacterium]|nr:L,D-transpeptidase family protein [Phycisphaerales bacterium]
MALPSQASRAPSWRSSGSSGGSGLALPAVVRRNKTLFAAGVTLALVAVGWAYFSPTKAAADAHPPTKDDKFLPSADANPGRPAPAGNAQPPAPATISMKSLNDPSGAARSGGGTSLDELLAQSGSQGQTQPPAAPPDWGKPAAPADAARPGGQLGPSGDPLNATPSGQPAPAGDVRGLIDQANALAQQNRPLEARKLLNDALLNTAATPDGRASLRTQIAALNETLFFSPTVARGDPLTDEHAVAPGETLGRIVRKEGLPIDWRLLVRINKLPTENALRVGQKLKIVRQPLHAVVHKNSYRMDVFAGPPGTGGSSGPDGMEPGWTYVRSFPVGLGESNGTPEGSFVVRANSKLVNPRWVNPRTGEVFQADDPKNPIGERWIGLEGVDDSTRRFAGYGIHGTIDPDSIGQQKSMGCVRMAPADVEVAYEMLVDRISTVKILP